MYVLVIFTDENNVAIVPSNWLEGTQCAVWPDHIKTSGKIMKAVMEKITPDDSWKAYPIRELYKNESFVDVRKRLRMAEEKSDLNTSPNEFSDIEGDQRRSKRKRKQTQFYSSDEDEDAPGSPILHPPSPLVPPKGSFGHSTPLWSAASEGSTPSQGKNSPSPAPEQPRSGPSPGSQRPEQPRPGPSPGPQRPEQPRPGPSPGSQRPEQPRSGPSPSNVDLPSSSLARDIRLFTTLEKIKKEQKETKDMVQQLLGMVQSLAGSGSVANIDHSAVPADISFPLGTEEEMLDAEEKLCDSTVMNGLVSYLTVLGGRNVSDTTRRVMGHAITNSLAMLYNWHGKKGKLSFGKLKICSVVQRAIMKTCKGITLTEAEVAIRTWFRTASDRDGGRQRRSRVKKSRTANDGVEDFTS